MMMASLILVVLVSGVSLGVVLHLHDTGKLSLSALKALVAPQQPPTSAS